MIWHDLAAPGCSWLPLAASGCSWVLLVAPGCSGLLLAASGCFWLLWQASCQLGGFALVLGGGGLPSFMMWCQATSQAEWNLRENPKKKYFGRFLA